jgi:nucleosome assembly protein 1-like 1
MASGPPGPSLFGGATFNFAPPPHPAPAAEEEGGDEEFVKEEEVTEILGWKASVSLDVVDVKSGEEEEEICFNHRAKLLRFVKESSEWKERGLGDAKILKHKQTGLVRFLMRQEKTNVLRANHQLVNKPPLCQLSPHGDSGKIWVWLAQDYADEEGATETLALKFGNVDAADKFKAAFEANCMGSEQSPKDAPTPAAPTPAATTKAAPKAEPKAQAQPAKSSEAKAEVAALTSSFEALGLDAKAGAVLEELKALDDQYVTIEKKYEEELAELQSKYEKQWFPIMDQRAKMLNPSGDTKVGTPQLPKFWLYVLKQSSEFEDLIEEHDEPLLESLQNIKYDWLDNHGKTGWKLHFHFAENEYIENKVITKVYKTHPENEFNSTLEYEKIYVEDPIRWKAGKNITVEMVPKKTKGGGKKKAKAKAKMEEKPRASFFRTFFRNLGDEFELPTDEEDEDEEDEDDEDFDLMEMYIQDDVEWSESLRDHIVQHAVRYYTGEACPAGDDDDDEDDDEDEDEDDEEGDDEDDDDDDDDDDDEDEDSPPSGKKAKGKGAGKGKGKGEQECKQQ